MRILFDFNHLVDINFFKGAILQLKKEGNEIIITSRKRGKLEEILKYELGDFQITNIGVHHKSFLTKIFFQLYRDLIFIRLLKQNKVNIVVCFGPTSAIAAKIKKIPYLAFDDDYEYKIPFYHANWFSTKHIYPDYITFKNKKTSHYHGFKELAYLHPNHLSPNEAILEKYGLIKDEYVFIREISQISLNYKTKNSLLECVIKLLEARGLKIVLSLEDKSQKSKFSSSCIILEEPVIDLYSIMYHSLLAISSGDTVARETSLLGIPTIYTGGRAMSINSPLIKAGVLTYLQEITDIEIFIRDASTDKKTETRNSITALIKNEWVDTTAVILGHINQAIDENNQKN